MRPILLCQPSDLQDAQRQRPYATVLPTLYAVQTTIQTKTRCSGVDQPQDDPSELGRMEEEN